MSTFNNINKKHTTDESDWAQVADNADKKAQEELEKIKREAHKELTNGKASFHNPDDNKV